MRIAFAVIAGYLVMAAVVIGASFGIDFGLDESYTFREDTLEPTALVSTGMLAAGCVAALLGGIVAARIAQTRWRAACIWLVGVVLVLGTLSAVGDWRRARSPSQNPPGTAEIARMNLREKWDQASKPMWFSVLAPLIGAASSLLGFRIGTVHLRGFPCSPPTSRRTP
jgi:hypothetical protein